MQVQRKKWVVPAAGGIVLLVLAVVLYSFASSVSALLSPSKYGLEWGGDILPNMVYLVVVAFVLLMGLQMILTLREDKTPFIAQNVRRLKAAGISLIVMEPVQVLVQAVLNHYRPLADGMKTTYVVWSGGIFIAVGVMILCLAAVFDCGLKMQKQWDETL